MSKAIIQATLDKHPLSDADYFHSQDYNGIILVWYFATAEESHAISDALHVGDSYQVNVGKQGFVVGILVNEIEPVKMADVEGREMYCHRVWVEYIRENS